MTPWTGDLSFAAGILDLTLWALLIADGRAERRLLQLAGALGIHFVGEGVGEAIRAMSAGRMQQSRFLLGSGLSVLADLAFLYLSWRALRQPAVAPGISEAQTGKTAGPSTKKPSWQPGHDLKKSP
jgi:hypothetical protein